MDRITFRKLSFLIALVALAGLVMASPCMLDVLACPDIKYHGDLFALCFDIQETEGKELFPYVWPFIKPKGCDDKTYIQLFNELDATGAASKMINHFDSLHDFICRVTNVLCDPSELIQKISKH